MYLNYKTFYSFRYSTFSTAALVETAVNNGVTALALTNINCTCDLWDFVKLCREQELNPLLGWKCVMKINCYTSCWQLIITGWYGSTNSFLTTCSINDLSLSLFPGKPF